MSKQKGSLSINSENIFPIIKKWLYSDHDIFYRELISNGCDAITKLKKLNVMGEYTIPDDMEFKITVSVNQEQKTITITDNGIGMTADEVNEYINQIAFSGAAAFLEQYKDKTNEDQIIGHFGLGFYSAFMVADRVTIDTLSYKEGSAAVHWECDGGTDYEMSEGTKDTIGTQIVLYLNEDSYEFSNEYRAREVITKYCSFMPVDIFLINENAPVEEPAKDEASDAESAENTDEAKEEKKPVPINDKNPLWNKHPNECTEEEYKDFYRKVFHDYKEPLFWIHLNMDYPFNLKGILYFPKLNTEYDTLEGTIKLYNNQVFIADNIKEVIPEFLLLLKGVIDCPDLPLNVSRSALQNDGFVKKISDYISKKVADKLSGMYKTDKENYEKYWDDINPFIKFGCLKDEKFAEKMNDFIIFKDLNGKYLTLAEYLEENKERCENTVFYVTNEIEQSQYINLFKEENLNAVILKHNIDSPFITHMEQKNENVKFVRIDSDLSDVFKEETSEDELKEISEKLTELFKKSLNNDKLEVKVDKLKNE
ncbi:MAG: molecular chaperone HtpG, partial [Lachnospiraceae bacterium]